MNTFKKSPAVLAFQRGIDISDGMFFNVDENGNETPLMVNRHGIRCTQNVNKKSTKDESVASAATAEEVRNLQITDSAKTSSDAVGINVRFGLKIMSLDNALHSIADAKGKGGVDLTAFKASIVDFNNRSKGSNGLSEVARRYARNLANGRWLWRNRNRAINIEVLVKVFDKSHDLVEELKFDAFSISINDFDDYSLEENKLSKYLKQSLEGDSRLFYEVTANMDLGYNPTSEVFPSQMFLGEGKKDGNASSKALYRINPVAWDGSDVGEIGQAAIRDAKIGNALRTIDTWYDNGESVRPIPVEPVGANITDQCFYRQGKKSAFEYIKMLNEIDPNSPDGMFMIASLIRGGVY